MDITQRNAIIAQLLGEGLSLSDVQKRLESEHGVKLTYMDLRLVAADLQVDWAKLDKVPKEKAIDDITKAKITKPAAEGDDAVEAEPQTVVTISKLVRPGYVFSGSVDFASGASADWGVDQYGRLALTPASGSAKPTEQDIQEFQMELQRQIQGKM